MKIIGYCIHDRKQYVAFIEDMNPKKYFKITDGFHDKKVQHGNEKGFEGYVWVDKAGINLEQIIRRMRGTRPWHPLLKLLRKESAA